MSYKGNPGPHRTRREPYYDAETKERGQEETWQGTEAAIVGMTQQLEAFGYSYRISSGGPIWELTVRIPQFDPDTEDVERFEISTVSREVSIFDSPDVVTAALDYDAILADGQDTFKKTAEAAVENKGALDTAILAALGTPGAAFVIVAFDAVVRHLKAGVTGYQIDTILLRISRRVSNAFALGASGRINLDESLLLYTTAQLNLPADVAFTLPTAPADFGDRSWKWKKRAQRSEITGSFTEQVVELEFAPWSTYLYTLSGANLDW